MQEQDLYYLETQILWADELMYNFWLQKQLKAIKK